MTTMCNNVHSLKAASLLRVANNRFLKHTLAFNRKRPIEAQVVRERRLCRFVYSVALYSMEECEVKVTL